MPQLKKPGEGSEVRGPGRTIPKPYRPIEVKDMYYNMNHKQRGLALIFNHENYDSNENLPKRRGTSKDRDRLDKILTNLGFKVQVHNDLNYKEIFNAIQAAAKMDHSNNDCLLITVLTHGDLGVLHAKDTYYKLKYLWCYFTEERCPTLAGKPKIFFIQACRGSRYDSGITLATDGPTALSENPTNPEFLRAFSTVQTNGPTALSENPTNPDFLLAFSTVAGYYSWRNSTNGSWFIQALCDILNDYATDTNIMTMLTYVCRKVALDFESYTDDLESNEMKAVPSIHSTLTRLLIFNNNS